MKIAIVTVYNTENCGSFLQSYALKAAIEKLGHKVYFLYRDLKGTDNTVKSHIRLGLIKCAKFQFGAAWNFWKRYFNFKTVNKNQSIVYRDTELFDDIDCFVLGSDTIWNFESKYFYENKNTYTGLNLPDVKKITYAVSAANTGCENFINDTDIKEGIKRLSAISVRDYSTKAIVENITGKSPVVVCDPTMLLDTEDYTSLMIEKSSRSDKKYILLYCFDSLSDIQKKHILELKNETGCKLVSFGEYRSWCDRNPAYAPDSFLSYMKNADFVVTNTFHGTIFSVLFHKNFADYGGKKLKISNLLNQLGLQDAIVDERMSLAEKYKMNLNYEKADEVISELRQQSLNYLYDSLGEA